jgi:hypothetical protein
MSMDATKGRASFVILTLQLDGIELRCVRRKTALLVFEMVDLTPTVEMRAHARPRGTIAWQA